MKTARTYTIKQTAGRTGISEDMDMKLEQGRIRRDCSEDGSEGASAKRRGERRPKRVSPAEMSYVPPARLFGGPQANEAAGDKR